MFNERFVHKKDLALNFACLAQPMNLPKQIHDRKVTRNKLN